MQTVEQQVSSPIKKYPFSKIVFTVASSITLAGLLFPSQGAAEEQVDLQSIVITSTMIDQDVETAPGTVDIIDKKEISRLGAENISDVLHQAAGVTFSTGAGRSNEVSIRGMGSGHTLILLDGRRISGSYNATVDVNQIPIVLVDRIEIVRGPSSAIYGSAATGGVVNIITRAAARQPEAEIEVRGGVGQAAEQSIQAMAGSAFGPLRSTIAVSHAKQDGYDTDISTSQEVDDTELDSVYLRSVLDLPGEHTVSFGGEWSRFERDGLRYYMKKNRIRQGDDNRVGGYLQYDTGDIGSFSATARVYGNHSEGSWDFSPYANADSNERDLVQAEIRTFYQFTPELLVTTGVEGREEKLEGAQMNSGYEGGASEKSGALFSQLSWNPSEQFNITGSLRYDDYDSAGNHLTPRLIATFYQQNFKVWASYGKGFRAATLDELYGSTTKKQGKYLYVGNDNLDPEISDSFEIGLEGHTDTIRSSLVFFYNDLEDLIEAHETGSSGGITTFTYANIESAETYGLEFAGGIDLTKNLHFSGHITWLQTENKETGYDLATEPEWKGQLKVTWLIPRLSLETQLRYFYFGDCEDGLGAAIDGYDGVGLHIEKKFGKNYAVYVGVENLFDEENDYFLQDPVQAYIGLRYTL